MDQNRLAQIRRVNEMFLSRDLEMRELAVVAFTGLGLTVDEFQGYHKILYDTAVEITPYMTHGKFIHLWNNIGKIWADIVNSKYGIKYKNCIDVTEW